MELNLDSLKIALEVTLVLGNVLAIVFMAYLRSSFVTRRDYEERDAQIQGRLAGFDLRVQSIENKLPDAKEWREIAVAIERLAGDIELVGSQVKGLEGLVERIEAAVTRQEQYIHELKD